MNSGNKKNVLMISPENGFGGAEKSFAQLSRILGKHFNVYIIFFYKKTDPVYSCYGEIFYLNTPPARNPVHSIINTLIRIKKIKAIKHEYNIKTSISFLEGANYLNIITKGNEKCIISIRGSIIHDPNIKGIGKILRRGHLIPYFYRKADNIVCISNGMKREIIDHFNFEEGKINVIYNSIDCKRIYERSQQTLQSKYSGLFNNFTIISHSRLSREKGIQYQLQFLKRLLPENPDLKLILIGDGPSKDSLIKLCMKLNLRYFIKGLDKADPKDYQVIFWGYTNNPYKLLGKADLFISTSTTEGFGNSIIEAMACKCAVISSDCPYGPRELIISEDDSLKKIPPEYPIFHRNGILMPTMNQNEEEELTNVWINTIDHIIHNKTTNHSIEAAYNRAKKFDNKELEKKWLNIINI